MRGLSVSLSVVALVLVGLLSVARLANTVAQEATPAALTEHPLIGTWRVIGTEAGVSSPLISTWSADGTVIGVDPLVFAAGPDFVVFETAALGTWEATGDDSGAFTIEYFASDAQGNLAGIVTVSGEWQASDDGQSATGEFTYSAADPAGNVFAAGRGTDEATRLTVVPMGSLATPAASPTA